MTPQEAVKMLINDHSWTQQKIAAAVECSQPTVAAIADGREPKFRVGQELILLARRVEKKAKANV